MMKVTVKSELNPPRPAPLDPRDERDLLAAICGWMSVEERRDLDARLAGDPALSRELERRLAAWSAVGDPPEVRLPWGFGRRLAAKALAERAADRALSGDWRTAPAWARLAAAAALVCGIAFGWTLSPTTSRVERVATVSEPIAPDSIPSTPVATAAPADSLADMDDLLGDEDLFGDTSPSLWEALASGDDDTAGSS